MEIERGHGEELRPEAEGAPEREDGGSAERKADDLATSEQPERTDTRSVEPTKAERKAEAAIEDADARPSLAEARGELPGGEEAGEGVAEDRGTGEATMDEGESTGQISEGRQDRPSSTSDLPPEVRETIDLIDAGGPFPYPDNDGAVFHNRESGEGTEGTLPEQPDGYYREYTVPTPGLTHRGEQRIVTGDEGREMWYTDDHYDTFTRIR